MDLIIGELSCSKKKLKDLLPLYEFHVEMSVIFLMLPTAARELFIEFDR